MVLLDFRISTTGARSMSISNTTALVTRRARRWIIAGAIVDPGARPWPVSGDEAAPGDEIVERRHLFFFLSENARDMLEPDDQWWWQVDACHRYQSEMAGDRQIADEEALAARQGSSTGTAANPSRSLLWNRNVRIDRALSRVISKEIRERLLISLS